MKYGSLKYGTGTYGSYKFLQSVGDGQLRTSSSTSRLFFRNLADGSIITQGGTFSKGAFFRNAGGGSLDVIGLASMLYFLVVGGSVTMAGSVTKIIMKPVGDLFKKYGAFKYGSNNYGVNGFTIMGGIEHQGLFLRELSSDFFAFANIQTIGAFFRNSGSGNIPISSTVLKFAYKLAGLGASAVSGSINRMASYFRNIARDISPSSTLSRLCYFIRNTGDGSINSFGSISKFIDRLLIGTQAILGNMSRQGTFLRQIYGELAPLGHASKLLQITISGVAQVTSTINNVFANFLVTLDGILQPLGVRVIDNRREILPSTRDNIEEIPGRHGEFDFGSEFKARTIELEVVSQNGMNAQEKGDFERKCARYLNPLSGIKKLVFGDDPDVEYNVKYSGQIRSENYPTWMKFVIPLKMVDPMKYGTEKNVLQGSGTIINNGSSEIGIVIEVTGPATNPSVTIGDQALKYTGTLSDSQTLTINTEAMTAKIGNSNAMAGYNGVFPTLPPGNTTVTAGSNVTIRWKDKWL